MSNSATITDLTTGGVRQQLIRYAVPIITTSLLQAVYAIVDMLVVSRFLGSGGASGVSNAAQVTTILSSIAIGLSNGGNIMVGQYFGNKDKKNQDETIGTFFSLFFLLGIAASVLCWLASAPFLTFMKAPSFQDAYDYLSISTLGFFFIFGYNAVASVLRAVGNSRKPMHFVMAGILLNVVLDLLFVGPMNMGTAGAALATVIGQAVTFLWALLYLLRHRDIFPFTPELFRIRGNKASMILQLGIPCAVQMTVAGISWLVVTYQINPYGADASAAAAYSTKIKDLSMMFITALSNAGASMIAQNLGAQKYDRAKEVLYTAMKMAVAMAVALTLLLEIGAPLFLSAFTTDENVLSIAVLNLRIEILGQVFYAIFLTYHALMIGAGHTWWVLFSSFINCILFRVILSISFNALWGLTGVFIACAIAPATSVPVGWLYTRSNRWRRSLAA